MASNNDSSFGTILGIGAIAFLAYLFWPRGASAATAQQQQNAQNNSLLSSLIKALMGGGHGIGVLPGGGGGIAPLPMQGTTTGVLGQFLGAINNIGLTAQDYYTSTSGFSSPALDNTTIPYQPTQQFDTSQISQPISTYDPSTDPSLMGTSYDPSVNNISFDPSGGLSMDGGGYQFTG